MESTCGPCSVCVCVIWMLLFIALFTGWCLLNSPPRPSSWLWAQSSATAGERRHRRDRPVPSSTGPRRTSSAPPANASLAVLTEVSRHLTCRLLSSVKCDWFQTGSPILIISWVVFLSHIANRHTSLIFDVSLSPIRNALAQSLVLKRSVFMCEWLVKMCSAVVQLWVCPSLPSYKHTQEVLSASHLQSSEAERLFSCADLICTVRGAENKRDGWCCCCRREAACLWVNSSELPGYELFICRKSPWDEWGCSSEV